MNSAQQVDLKRPGYRILAAAGTWLVVTFAYLSPLGEAAWSSGKTWGLASALLYGLAIFVATRNRVAARQPSLVARYAALVIAALALLGMVLAHPRDIVFILAIIIAAILPEYFSFRRSVFLQLVLHCALAGAYYLRWDADSGFFAESLLWLTFQAFALLSSQIAADERRARQELEFSHKQLAATQDMLANTSRQDERLRISRDIHDVLGHHLTGLSLQLEVASHSEGAKAREHLAQAQLIAKLLLSDVRQVVNDLRDVEALDLGQALRSLAENTGAIRVRLHLPTPFRLANTPLAEVVFRSVQEIITNAVRHSRGDHLDISIAEDEGRLRIEANDNGQLPHLPVEGNGLKGMRERIEEIGGNLSLDVAGGLAYRICLWLPAQ